MLDGVCSECNTVIFKAGLVTQIEVYDDIFNILELRLGRISGSLSPRFIYKFKGVIKYDQN